MTTPATRRDVVGPTASTSGLSASTRATTPSHQVVTSTTTTRVDHHSRTRPTRAVTVNAPTTIHTTSQ
ncbi:Uncharacterised protein [Mycobacteroides abscessus]|nr:Uncharacterised protein [Mycobacteroides abscessus]